MDMGIASAVIITIATIGFISNMAMHADPERMALARRHEDERSMLHELLAALVAWAVICLVPILVLAGF
jgi:Na+/proline symporter